MASEFFERQRECRFYTDGCENKMAVSHKSLLYRALSKFASMQLLKKHIRDQTENGDNTSDVSPHNEF